MKKLNYFLLLIPFLLLSCSKDSSSSETYSIQGTWKTTSAVLNGVQIFGGTNTIKSEKYFFYANGDFDTESFTDTNYNNLYSYSLGTYTLPSTSTLILSADVYSPSDVFIDSYNLSCQVVKLNATQLELKVLNFPNPNDVYVKKFIR